MPWSQWRGAAAGGSPTEQIRASGECWGCLVAYGMRRGGVHFLGSLRVSRHLPSSWSTPTPPDKTRASPLGSDHTLGYSGVVRESVQDTVGFYFSHHPPHHHVSDALSVFPFYISTDEAAFTLPQHH